MRRILIERKADFNRNRHRASDICAYTGILSHLGDVRLVRIYDLYNCPQDLENTSIAQVLCDPVVDNVLDDFPEHYLAVILEYVPGCYDQRADSAEQCLRALDKRFENTRVLCAEAWLVTLGGQTKSLRDDEIKRIRKYLLNPIEKREKDMKARFVPYKSGVSEVERYGSFLTLSKEELAVWHCEHGLAMSLPDLLMVQKRFQFEGRAPTETDIRALDTYWSDHCRHTTFNTELEDVQFPNSKFCADMEEQYRRIMLRRTRLGTAENMKPINISLMDMATAAAKELHELKKIVDVEFSDEINACSVQVQVDENGVKKPWLLQFKNETHNHPTEIEPFGGAATCIGGAIRDPLAGRAYVYQAMRISGSADPRETFDKTLEGKLPQRLIALGSAAGASSYGNQIGLATGQVVEYYHEGYKAKHMELGAVVGAVPLDHVNRRTPAPNDIILLVGGATGRDGIGGATGSSKSQHSVSIYDSISEVQKGNAPEERKLQRLFSHKIFADKIKRCNDFGAGGVAVAVGELADGIIIDLDAIPVKYHGLTGTELAISESQERMAIVVAPEHVEYMIHLAAYENVNATPIGMVTEEKRLIMRWRDKEIVNLSREFLNTNGAKNVQKGVEIADVNIAEISAYPNDENWQEKLKEQLAKLKFADQRALGDRFDHSVGASCVLLPYGGKTQRTPSEASVYLFPTETQTTTASILAHGFNPDLSSKSPYHGGMTAVVDATSRLVAVGGNAMESHYSLQEYFPKLGTDPKKWGLAVAALLGANHALFSLERAAIGGKDSMSGSFNELDVPPTLVAFAVGVADAREVFSPEFKAADEYVYWLRCSTDQFALPKMDAFKQNNEFIKAVASHLSSVRAVRHGGVIQALYECSLGNEIGVKVQVEDLFKEEYGSYLLTSKKPLPQNPSLQLLGVTTNVPELKINDETLNINELYQIATGVLESVYTMTPEEAPVAEDIPLATAPQELRILKHKTATPKVCVPVFFGMNSELDTARAFRRNGAETEEFVFCNRTVDELQQSIETLARRINDSQIFALSGGFSAGDEPDGSGKFIANIIANPLITESLENLLRRDGLIIGICNGFQALIKTGLLPLGRVEKPKEGAATLYHNTLYRHISRVATTVVANNHSPWLSDFKIGEAHDVDFSHGEGRFIASPPVLNELINTGQIAFQYANPHTLQPTMDSRFNPNGSLAAVEGIISPCGRILGKMGHSERYQQFTHKNFPNFRSQNIFAAGVKAFT